MTDRQKIKNVLSLLEITRYEKACSEIKKGYKYIAYVIKTEDWGFTRYIIFNDNGDFITKFHEGEKNFKKKFKKYFLK